MASEFHYRLTHLSIPNLSLILWFRCTRTLHFDETTHPPAHASTTHTGVGGLGVSHKSLLTQKYTCKASKGTADIAVPELCCEDK